MRKFITIAVVFVVTLAMMLTFSLTGCKTAETAETTAAATTAAAAATTAAAETTAAATTAAAEPITLEFWSWNNEGSYPIVHEDAEKRFMADFPNVTVKREYISYTDYLVKLKAVISGEAAPDIFQIPWAGEYTELARSGKLLPLTDKLKENFPEFFPSVMNAISVDGDAWAVPLDLNTLQIAYNMNMFKEMGLEIPKSQEELIALAKKLADAGKFGIAQGTKDLWTAADSFFAQVAYTDPTHTKMMDADAGKIGWDDPVFLQAAKNMAALVAAGVYAPGANSMDAFVGAKDLFVQQQSAMFYPVGNFITGGITTDIAGAFEYSLFPTPPLKAGDEFLPTGGVAEMFVISKDSANVDMAVEFMRYLTNDKGKDTLVANDFIPSSTYNGDLANKSELYQNMLNAQSKTQSRVVYNTKVYTAIMNGMQGIFGAELTPEDFIKSLVEAAK
jgi:raffinose/stachyose/melibiose transport system substrate-binding protein